MQEFNTTLRREKFTIYDPQAGGEEKSVPTSAQSNRMVIRLLNTDGLEEESFVVRTQNMHACVRMAARILKEFDDAGAIMRRKKWAGWDSLWDSITSDYERTYNKNRWICIYTKGAPIFKDGGVHPLLDLVEKCDFENNLTYEESYLIAEKALKKSGKALNIEHDANIALNAHFTQKESSCGLILRAAGRATIFNFKTKLNDEDEGEISYSQILNTAAAFLEGIQLSYMIGFNRIKTMLGIIEEKSQDDIKTQDATKYIGRLKTLIDGFENSYQVSYRPERPDFSAIISETEILAQKTFKALEEETLLD